MLDSTSASARDRILVTARAMLERQTYNEFSLDAVAIQSRVTRRTLYNHFASKRELYGYIRTEMLRTVMLKRITEIPERMGLEDGIAFFVEYAHSIVSDPTTVHVLRAIARDGEQHGWLREEYRRLVRDPMIIVLDNYLLRRLRRGDANCRLARNIGDQLLLSIEALFIHPLLDVREVGVDSVYHQVSIKVVKSAFTSLLTSQSDIREAA